MDRTAAWMERQHPELRDAILAGLRYTSTPRQSALISAWVWARVTVAGPFASPADLLAAAAEEGHVCPECGRTSPNARALAKLQSAHPDAAAVVACVLLLDMHVTELASVFGTRRNWGRLVNKAIAWMAGYLSGWTIADCEEAYRRAA